MTTDTFAADRDKFARLDAAESLLTYANGIASDMLWTPPDQANYRDAHADAVDLLLSVGVNP